LHHLASAAASWKAKRSKHVDEHCFSSKTNQSRAAYMPPAPTRLAVEAYSWSSTDLFWWFEWQRKARELVFAIDQVDGKHLGLSQLFFHDDHTTTRFLPFSFDEQ